MLRGPCAQVEPLVVRAKFSRSRAGIRRISSRFVDWASMHAAFRSTWNSRTVIRASSASIASSVVRSARPPSRRALRSSRQALLSWHRGRCLVVPSVVRVAWRSLLVVAARPPRRRGQAAGRSRRRSDADVDPGRRVDSVMVPLPRRPTGSRSDAARGRRSRPGSRPPSGQRG